MNLTKQEKEILKDLFETEPKIKRTYQYAISHKDTEMLKYLEKSIKRMSRYRVA